EALAWLDALAQLRHLGWTVTQLGWLLADDPVHKHAAEPSQDLLRHVLVKLREELRLLEAGTPTIVSVPTRAGVRSTVVALVGEEAGVEDLVDIVVGVSELPSDPDQRDLVERFLGAHLNVEDVF